jgi:hypothetical protein
MDISINRAPTHMDLLTCLSGTVTMNNAVFWYLLPYALVTSDKTAASIFKVAGSKLLQTNSRILPDHVAVSQIRQHSSYFGQNLTSSVIHCHAALQSHCALFWYLSCAINNDRDIYNKTGNVCTVLHFWHNAMCILATNLEPIMFIVFKTYLTENSLSPLLRTFV